MDLWFSEQHAKGVQFMIQVEEQLYTAQSEFQKIDVFYAKEFGRFLTLDGFIMLTEKDEYIYHEMMTHVPLAVHPAARKILVIGAGDGGTVRELTRYETVTHIDMVEIDAQVVQVCREYLPQTACCLDDKRVHIHYEDGLKFVRSKYNEYDLIIVDSTDPFGPGEGLFTKEFYGNCFKALCDDGMMINQHESVYYAEYVESVRKMHHMIKSIFPIAKVYQAHIPTYPSGQWLFGFASKRYHPLEIKEEAWNRLGIVTKYYNTALHRGCFAIPNDVREVFKGVE